MVQSMKTCLVQDHPFLKSAHSSLRIKSICPCSHLIRTQQKTLPTTERKVMPHQLLQSLRFPFLGTMTIIPLLQSTEMFSLFQMLLKRFVSFSIIMLWECFNNSGRILSIPGALLCFRKFHNCLCGISTRQLELLLWRTGLIAQHT